MDNNILAMPPIAGKYTLRATGEEVEVIDFEIKEKGARSDEDWVTYIDSKGAEHIREHLNIQLDFKAVGNNLLEKMLDVAKPNKFPTERNRRIFEVAKELVKNGSHVSTAVSVARQLVDEVGIESE